MLDDVRYAWRALYKAPAFCAVVIVTLALGLGANTAVFSVINAAILTPLPYSGADRLVRVTLERAGEHRYFPGAGLTDLRANSRTLDVASVYTYSEQSADLTDRGRPERVPLTLVSANYFDVMGVVPIAGRTFRRDEERPNVRVAVVSERIWHEYLGGSSAAMGRSLTMNGYPVQVVGVLPSSFADPLQPRVEIWTPEDLETPGTNTWGNNRLSVIGRLRPGVSLEDARAEAQVLVARQATNYGVDRPTAVRVVPLQTALVGAAGPMLYVLLSAVALLLLLACVNVASLMLARAAGRAQEMTVRAALGSARWRLVRQLLTESVILSLAGGAAGLALAAFVARALLAAAPVSIIQPDAAAFDLRVFAYCFAVALLAGVAFGVVPALHASRPDLEAALREGGRSVGASRRQTRTWNVLVAGQVCVALVLLVAAGLLLKSFQRLRTVDLGIRAENVLTFQVNLPGGRYSEAESRASFHRELHRRLSALPGVTAVGAVSRLPVTGTYHSWGTRQPGVPDARLFSPEQRVIEGDYFKALGIPLLRGRTFDAQDHAGVERRVLISQSLADIMFPGQDPLGRRIQVLSGQVAIIGVVGDVALDARGTRAPGVYHSHVQFAANRNWALTQVVSGTSDPARLEAIRRELAAIDPALVVHQPQALTDVIGRGQARERFSLQLIAAFAVLALALAAIGLYGVLAYSVTSRRKEIGIRLALGAPPGAVRSMFVMAGSRLAVTGLGAGIVLALLLTRGLESLLFEISAADPLVFAAAAGALALVSAGAAWIPARAATRVDPVEALGK